MRMVNILTKIFRQVLQYPRHHKETLYRSWDEEFPVTHLFWWYAWRNKKLLELHISEKSDDDLSTRIFASFWKHEAEKSEFISAPIQLSRKTVWTAVWRKRARTCSHSVLLEAMGVGRIFSRGGHGDFSKNFSGGAKNGEFCFFLSKIRKQPFFAKHFKIKGGQGPPAPLPTPLNEVIAGSDDLRVKHIESRLCTVA